MPRSPSSLCLMARSVLDCSARPLAPRGSRIAAAAFLTLSQPAMPQKPDRFTGWLLVRSSRTAARAIPIAAMFAGSRRLRRFRRNDRVGESGLSSRPFVGSPADRRANIGRGSRFVAADFVVDPGRKACPVAPPQHGGARRVRWPRSSSSLGADRALEPPTSSSLRDGKHVPSLLLSTAARDPCLIARLAPFDELRAHSSAQGS